MKVQQLFETFKMKKYINVPQPKRWADIYKPVKIKKTK